jgi:hypothetical protein
VEIKSNTQLYFDGKPCGEITRSSLDFYTSDGGNRLTFNADK